MPKGRASPAARCLGTGRAVLDEVTQLRLLLQRLEGAAVDRDLDLAEKRHVVVAAKKEPPADFVTRFLNKSRPTALPSARE